MNEELINKIGREKSISRTQIRDSSDIDECDVKL